MEKLINETEYMYASAKIRAMENRLPTKEMLERLVDCSAGEAEALLKERGIDIGDGGFDATASKLSSEYEEVAKSVPDSDIVKVFMCQYDCNNIKIAQKCAYRGIDPDGMLFLCGSVPKSAVVKAVRENDFSAFPKNMAEAGKEAHKALSATGNPQAVDMLLDRACYLDMLELSKPYGGVFDWVKLKIDTLNALTCMRIMRMGGDAAEAMLKESLLDGGDVPKTVFEKAFSKGEDALLSELRYGKLARFAEKISAKSPLSVIEKAADDLFMEKVRETRFVSFGAQIPAAYLIALEYALKNVRMILAGKDAQLDAETIRSKLRENYV